MSDDDASTDPTDDLNALAEAFVDRLPSLTPGQREKVGRILGSQLSGARMEATELSPDYLSGYYGVVLSHQYGGSLRWSPVHSAWLRLRHDGRAWATEPVEGDEVDPEELETALALAAAFPTDYHCSRCWGPAAPSTHFIVVDVLGKPAVHCVYRPSPAVVGSPGGDKKHLGHPLGCIAVKAETVAAALPGVGDHETVGGYIYGMPLTADEVMIRDWCSRCATAVAGLDAEPTAAVRREHEHGAKRFMHEMSLWLEPDGRGMDA